jgi:hypothetical protein
MSFSRSGFVVAGGGGAAVAVGEAALGVGAGDGRAQSRIGRVGVAVVARCLLRGHLGRQVAGGVTLGENLDREVRAVTFAQAAANAIRGLDDRVVGQQQAVLGADLDADVASLAPFVDPADVDEVDDVGSAMGLAFGGG